MAQLIVVNTTQGNQAQKSIKFLLLFNYIMVKTEDKK